MVFILKSSLDSNSSELLAGIELNNDNNNMKIKVKKKKRKYYLLYKTIEKVLNAATKYVCSALNFCL